MQAPTHHYQIQQFRADSLDDALRRIAIELGPDAQLMESKTVWDGWWKGLWGKRQRAGHRGRPPPTGSWRAWGGPSSPNDRGPVDRGTTTGSFGRLSIPIKTAVST